MEIERRDFRAMIFYDYMRGLTGLESHQFLLKTFGVVTPSRSTVFSWFAEFRRGRGSLLGEARPGRPSTAVNEESVEEVRKLVSADPRLTYTQIEEELGLSSTALNRILHECLSLRKLAARWVPHQLTLVQKEKRKDFCEFMLKKFDEGRSKRVYDIYTGDESWIYQYDPEAKRQSSIWVFPGEAAPMKFKRSRSVGKQMVASFFSKKGHIASIPLEEQRTVTVNWYIDVCIPRVFHAWQSARPKTGLRGLLWHHDNASVHTAGKTIDFLT